MVVHYFLASSPTIVCWSLTAMKSAFFLPLVSLAVAVSAQGKPNFVFILADDQDYELGSLDYMPLLKQHIAQQGTAFDRHHVTTAQCCPSRATLWTGKATHNTNVTDVELPNGGYGKFTQMGLNEKYLPVFLSAAGYSNFYVGKWMNGMDSLTYGLTKTMQYMKGWTSSDILLAPNVYWYYDALMRRDKGSNKSYKGQYSTDVIRDKGLAYIDEAHATGKPFFVGIAPIGPHEHVPALGDAEKIPESAERHKDLFPNATVPRTDNFNPSVASGGGWVLGLDRQSEDNVAFNDRFYRRRLQALQAVDELVEAVVKKLEDLQLLDNTYIIYTSDNGYHIGQHRLQPGKGCAYETDVHVPMFIRGPGVKVGGRVTVPTTHIDVLPTIFSLAGIPLRDDFDGTPMPLAQIPSSADSRPEHVGIEFWGDVDQEGEYGGSDDRPLNTYKSLRILSEGDYSLSYTVWCSGDYELYDMTLDGVQMNNLIPASGLVANATIEIGGQQYSAQNVWDRLDAVVQAVKRCIGSECIKPWATLHPQGDVKTLAEAMAPKYDDFYSGQVKMKFNECIVSYQIDNEGELPKPFPG
ncbi:putative arylsulfatase [Auriculariales sp. MPI-PUGE-AT-0066]|nr:putative arylsulfatase [Auriculariales sp. MPI-PUGE-AT-0066]